MAVRMSALRAGRSLPRKISGTHFYYRLSLPQCHSAARRIKSTEKSSDLIWNRTRDLLACSILPQPTILQRQYPETDHDDLFHNPHSFDAACCMNWNSVRRHRTLECRYLSGTLYALAQDTMDKVQKPSDSECYTPSPEPFTFCHVCLKPIERYNKGYKSAPCGGGLEYFHRSPCES
jgi:hypothetical protein